MRRVLGIVGLVLLAAGVVFAGSETLSPDVTAPPPKDTSAFIVNDAAHAVPVVQQGTMNVNVTNGPLPVQVVDRRSPYQAAISSDNFGTSRFRSFVLSIPEGQMLVVEMVSCTASVESGQKARAAVSVQGGPLPGDEFGGAHHLLIMEKMEGFGPKDVYTVSRPITGYAGGVEGLVLGVERNSDVGIGGRVECSISGYLVDVPVATRVQQAD